MEGRVHGTAATFDSEGNVASTVLVNIPFRAGNWQGGAWPCN